MTSPQDRLPARFVGEKDSGAGLEKGPSFASRYPLRILIAEDNPVNRKVLHLMLRRLGYQADCVENGLECLKAVLAGSYDLILSDINMPKMGGDECAARLRQAGVGIPMIAVTASSIPNAHEHFLREGMDGYLPKPVPPDELRRVLRETFDKKEFATPG